MQTVKVFSMVKVNFSQGRCNPKSEAQKGSAYSSDSISFWRDACPLLFHLVHASEKEEEKR